jgi:NAD(P)-dependent dehydrogenase (short-subunit alcohol dehydrogenase family)
MGVSISEHWSVRDVPDLLGKTALVTGANTGLGFEIARIFAQHGARVILACRNEEKALTAASVLRDLAPNGEIEVQLLDLASLASIEACSNRVLASESRLDILVNNAGLMAIDESRTVDGFEMQFGVNHLGAFALTARLMPLLLATAGSRVIAMSSMGHYGGRMHFDDLMFERHTYHRWPPYFQSKLANLLFTAELQHRLGPNAPTKALAAHPGGSRTELGAEGSGVSNFLMRYLAPLGTQPAAQGALPAVRASVDPTAKGGDYYGPRYMVIGRAVKQVPNKRARNMKDAAQLWDISEQMTQLHFPTSL